MKNILKNVMKIAENSCLTPEEKNSIRNFIQDMLRKQEIINRKKIIAINDPSDEDYHIDDIIH